MVEIEEQSTLFTILIELEEVKTEGTNIYQLASPTRKSDQYYSIEMANSEEQVFSNKVCTIVSQQEDGRGFRDTWREKLPREVGQTTGWEEDTDKRFVCDLAYYGSIPHVEGVEPEAARIVPLPESDLIEIRYARLFKTRAERSMLEDPNDSMGYDGEDDDRVPSAINDIIESEGMATKRNTAARGSR